MISLISELMNSYIFINELIGFVTLTMVSEPAKVATFVKKTTKSAPVVTAPVQGQNVPENVKKAAEDLAKNAIINKTGKLFFAEADRFCNGLKASHKITADNIPSVIELAKSLTNSQFKGTAVQLEMINRSFGIAQAQTR
jgi:hypothetical protein